MVPITTRGLVKRFGAVTAVDGVDLDVGPGDLFFLLGPSGCGKTTLLRMLAGFTDPTAGTIRFGDRDVTHDPPNRRDTGMVFQGYALWPHMTVAQNVAFGLTVGRRKGQFTPEQRKAKVDAALAVTQMHTYAHRKPNELSGGQQQRVALSRALVVEPEIILLDEPLSNLDAKLRLEMRSQIREICKGANITAVYVTHDQKEALSMADRIAVMNAGRVVQVGPPRQLYHRPASRFVADFLGETNFISAEVRSREADHVVLDSPVGPLRSSVYPADLPKTGNVTCSIRPEALHLERQNGEPMAGPNRFAATVAHATYLGEVAQYLLHVTDQAQLKAFELNPAVVATDAGRLHVRVDPQDVVVLGD